MVTQQFIAERDEGATGDARGDPEDATQALTFSLDETTGIGIGIETGTPVGEDYGNADNRFTGTISWVRPDLGLDSHDHLIDPADLYAIAMTNQ
ncbi:hypothetical protein [Subtercola lobariae]|uniref:Uncharacterized protein n=1 Tax=Subtercola lobariae TaxID=1588641 RepID=A0A917F286_9MICO|nr:hypothetical protein [Subtercola lobariae]GGF41247.1 hypothetical protein GCM10011399_37420 [Subtercola lobariae]